MTDHQKEISKQRESAIEAAAERAKQHNLERSVVQKMLGLDKETAMSELEKEAYKMEQARVVFGDKVAFDTKDEFVTETYAPQPFENAGERKAKRWDGLIEGVRVTVNRPYGETRNSYEIYLPQLGETKVIGDSEEVAKEVFVKFCEALKAGGISRLKGEQRKDAIENVLREA